MKIFKKIKEIKSRSGELYFERWAIIDCKYFGFYVHRIHKADKDLHLHSHPWNFVSVILKGSYLEKYESTDLFLDTQYFLRYKDEFTFGYGDKNYFHKITTIAKGPVYSLFFVYNKRPKWYYKVDGQLIESEEYRKKKHETGFKS